MDSLLSNYASSDEEEQEPQQQQKSSSSSSSYSSSKVSALFSSLPQPKLPLSNPKTQLVKQNQQQQNLNPTKPTSIFSSLPQPKSQSQQQQQQHQQKPKKIVEFRPPINLSTIKPTDFDDDDKDTEEEKQIKKPKESESLTVKSFLSTIPAPKNSSILGVLPSSGSGSRRSIIETEAPVSSSTAFKPEEESGNTQNNVDNYYVSYDTNYPNYETVVDQSTGNYVNYGSYETYDQNVSSGDALSYGSYENYGNYVDYGLYGNNSGDGSVSIVPQTAAAVSHSVVRMPGKRGRKDVPIDIVEVKQDELIKDRPREDQVKLTGIAFGPSYQPVSTKGKPSKLHKRKHQIGTLYYDMKQKEMELSERRSKGFLTKAETQAKYGW